MSIIRSWFESVKDYLDVPLMTVGAAQITLWTIIHLIVLVLLLFYLSGKLRKWIAEDLLSRTRMEVGARQADLRQDRQGPAQRPHVGRCPQHGLDLQQHGLCRLHIASQERLLCQVDQRHDEQPWVALVPRHGEALLPKLPAAFVLPEQRGGVTQPESRQDFAPFVTEFVEERPAFLEIQIGQRKTATGEGRANRLP